MPGAEVTAPLEKTPRDKMRRPVSRTRVTAEELVNRLASTTREVVYMALRVLKARHAKKNLPEKVLAEIEERFPEQYDKIVGDRTSKLMVHVNRLASTGKVAYNALRVLKARHAKKNLPEKVLAEIEERFPEQYDKIVGEYGRVTTVKGILFLKRKFEVFARVHGREQLGVVRSDLGAVCDDCGLSHRSLYFKRYNLSQHYKKGRLTDLVISQLTLTFLPLLFMPEDAARGPQEYIALAYRVFGVTLG